MQTRANSNGQNIYISNIYSSISDKADKKHYANFVEMMQVSTVCTMVIIFVGAVLLVTPVFVALVLFAILKNTP